MGSVSWPLGSVPVPAWTYEYLHSVHTAHAVVYTDVVLSWFIRQTVLHRKVHCAVYSNCLI